MEFSDKPQSPTPLPTGWNDTPQQITHYHAPGGKTKTRGLAWWYASGLLVALIIGGTLGYWYGTAHVATPSSPNDQKPVAFLLEIYDSVKQNYWDKLSDSQLTDIYRRAAEKLTSVAQPIDLATREGLRAMLLNLFKPLDQAKAQDTASQMGDIVVANLTPFARSRLYTNQKREALQDQIKNIDQTTNLYDALGVAKTASAADIQKAYTDKTKALASKTTPEAQQQLAQANRAFRTLGTADTKQRYDQTGAEPTITARAISPDTLYVKINQIAPATVDEFKSTMDSFAANTALASLVLDLRDNNGGDIDTVPALLGYFLGQNQTAFELFHQGDTTPIKTTTNALPSVQRFKKVVVLVNSNTQSSAEVMAANLKKYHLGVLMGATTRGWGTVETIYGLHTSLSDNATYSLVLVHYVTLRDDEQPIEGRGVEPNINLHDANWPQQLLGYFNYPSLVEAVKQMTTGK